MDSNNITSKQMFIRSIAFVTDPYTYNYRVYVSFLFQPQEMKNMNYYLQIVHDGRNIECNYDVTIANRYAMTLLIK